MSNQNTFKKYFISVANQMLQQREKRNFEIDSNNKFAMDFFIAYFSDTENLSKMGGKARKGVFLHGGIGTGKSLLFEILDEIYKAQKNPIFRIKTIHTIALAESVISELSRPNQFAPNDKSTYTKSTTGSIHFEDLGAERKLNHFGNSIEVMSDIIQLRYCHLKKASYKTFITTNLCPDEVRNRYGERVYDRMFEMFNFIEMTGKSRRK